MSTIPHSKNNGTNGADQEPTLQDVIQAVNQGFTNVAIEFQEVKQDIAVLEQNVSGINARMVTKEYLDEKLSDLKGDMNVLFRKEDRKVVALITELQQTRVLSDDAAKRILALEPFPQN